MNYLDEIESYFRSLLVTYQTTNISWPNRKYAGSESSFLQFFFMPSLIRQAGMGTYGLDERRGLLQVNVVEEQGSGVKVAGDKANDLEVLFYRGRSAVYNGVNVTIERTQVDKGINDEDKKKYVVPVSVFWHSFTNPH